MRAYKNNKQILPRCSSLRQKIDESQSHQQEFLLVGIDIAFVVTNKRFVNMVTCYKELTDEGLGIYPLWKKYTFFLPTLDGSVLILRPR